MLHCARETFGSIRSAEVTRFGGVAACALAANAVGIDESAERGRSLTRVREFRRAACGARGSVVERAGACESLDKEKPTLSAITEPRRQGPRKSLTPCVEAFGNVFSRERVWRFRGRLVTVCPYESRRRWKTKANQTRKTPNFPGEIPRLPRERAIGADSTRDGRLTPESTGESARVRLKTHRAPVEGPGGKRGQYPRFAARRDRTRASPLNRAMVSVSKARAESRRARCFSNRREGCCCRVRSRTRAGTSTTRAPSRPRLGDARDLRGRRATKEQRVSVERKCATRTSAVGSACREPGRRARATPSGRIWT